jgi:hypothetical protein
MVMFGVIVSAAFVWTLVPDPTAVSLASTRATPVKAAIHQPASEKTSRLPISSVDNVDRACKGQSWGGETARCLNMIARGSGKGGLRVRLIADAAPIDPNTPNLF